MTKNRKDNLRCKLDNSQIGSSDDLKHY